MNDSSLNQETQINNEVIEQENVVTYPENSAYFKLRRTALVSTIVLIVVILITLLYLNGKSLYEHGL